MDMVPALTILVTISYLISLFFTWQAGLGPDSDLSLGFFKNSLLNASDNNPTPLTPAGYTFAIWGPIYSSTFAWIIYLITTLVRTNAKGPVYLHPPITSPAFLLAFWLNQTLNVTWCFAYDRAAFILSTTIFVGIAITLYVDIAISTSRVYDYLFELKEYGRFDLWANRILVHNGLALFATWTAVGVKTQLATLLIYTFGIDEETTTWICLGILGSQLITYFFLDCFVYDRYTRYILIVYPTVLWSLGGILVNNIDEPDSPQAVLGSTLFALVFIFFVIKTVFLIIRDPVYVIAKQRKAEAGAAYLRIHD